MEFHLHPSLQKKLFVTDLPLCRILLANNQLYPWLFLVPRRPDVFKIMDLPHSDQLQLLKELDFTQKLLWNEFQPKQINVAAIGNKVPQLHIHVIARFENDPAWPNTAWDYSEKPEYEENSKASIIQKLQQLFDEFGNRD